MPAADHHATSDETFPILIGGVGGSGTRLFAESLLAAGLRTLGDINGATDSMGCALLFKRPQLIVELEDPATIERLWSIVEAAIQGGSPLDRDQRGVLTSLRRIPRPMHSTAWLRVRARRLRRAARARPASGRWFIKEPNLHWPAPKLLELRPDQRFVMAVRHGVDMAFSTNQQQVEVWGPTVLGEPDLPIDAVASLRYWCLVHERILEVRERFPERVLIISFDQFCVEPERVLPALFEFCGITPTPERIQRGIRGVKPPTSIGRHRAEDCSGFSPENLDFAESFMSGIRIP
ncbi:MAG: sulfotransferase [Planctomycetota bacterium]|nr:sulfotransferase [Planctomycetota bacterium]